MATNPKAVKVAAPAKTPVAAAPIAAAIVAIEANPIQPAIVEPVIVEPAIVEPAIVEPAIVEPATIEANDAAPVAAPVPVKSPAAPVAVAFPAAPSAVVPPTVRSAVVPMEKVVKTAEEFVAFGQGNVEAFVKSSQIWTAGVQDISKQVAATAQAQMEETMSVFKAMTAVKSFKDMFDLQSAFAKAAMEKTLAESGKLSDASMKLTEQAIAPIAARVTMAVESFGKAA